MKKNNSKRKGIKFENKVRKSIMSGALSTDPLDLSVGDKCIECKWTDKSSYRVTKELLEKMWVETLDMQKTPYLMIGIPRNDHETFILTCSLTVEKRESKK